MNLFIYGKKLYYASFISYLYLKIFKSLSLFILACLPHSFFVTTRNVNGKVFHDSILSSHWMKVRNRHKNGNFALQKIVQSRHWISVSGTLPLFKKSKIAHTLYLKWIIAASHLRISPTLFNQHAFYVVRLIKK